MVGETISHYRVLEQIGAGGMGVDSPPNLKGWAAELLPKVNPEPGGFEGGVSNLIGLSGVHVKSFLTEEPKLNDLGVS